MVNLLWLIEGLFFVAIVCLIATATPWLIWQAFSLLYSFWQAMGVM